MRFRARFGRRRGGVTPRTPSAPISLVEPPTVTSLGAADRSTATERPNGALLERLPLVTYRTDAEPVDGADPDLHRTPLPGGGETVLVVEDEPALRELERLILETAGYRVLAAATGKEALELATGTPLEIDLLVADVVLPGLCGPKLAQELAAAGRPMPVVFVSGYDTATLAARGITPGDETVVFKPFREDALLAEVRAALDRDGFGGSAAPALPPDSFRSR